MAASSSYQRIAIVCAAALALMATAAAAITYGRRTKINFKQIELHTISRQNVSVIVREDGALSSSENIEIKSKVRGDNTITWVVENGSVVKAGDEILRLDTLLIEDEITERTKNAHASRSGADQAKANLEKARIAIEEYQHGRFKMQLMELEKNRTIAESNLTSTQSILNYQEEMRDRGYVSDLDVEQQQLSVQQFQLIKEYEEIQIDVLKNFSQDEERERLLGDFKAAQAEYAAADERSKMDAIRRDLAISELANCTIRAERDGAVLYPSGREWERKPQIEEGATVHQEQLLLLMPNLDKMQVEIGIHESMIERIRKGLPAEITFSDTTVEGTVREVATVARPSGWWTGGVVRYDTLVQLPPGNRTSTGQMTWAGQTARAGMSASVEIVLADYPAAITIPVDAVIQSSVGSFCWIRIGDQVEKRRLTLGETDDKMIVVHDGVELGNQVVLMPAKWIDDAKQEAGRRRSVAAQRPSESKKPVAELTRQKQDTAG